MTMTLSGRTYELLPYLEEHEQSISRFTLEKRGKKLNANLGSDVGERLLIYQSEIPKKLRKYFFVFPAWLSKSKEITYIAWNGDHWSRFKSENSEDQWGSSGYLLRHYIL